MTKQILIHSEKFLKQRKFFTVLPLIVVPFVTIIFWLLGGGSGTDTVVQKKAGLNTQLPDANLKNQPAQDKLSFYAMADRDSVKRAEDMRMDPNYSDQLKSSKAVPNDESEEVVSRKLMRPQKQADEPVYHESAVKREDVESSGEIERLQSMMQAIGQKKSDPEIDALNRTLDKLLEIQNPGRVKHEEPPAKKGNVFSVSSNGSNNEASYFGKAVPQHANGFLSDANELKDSTKAGTITAVVHGEQILVAGSVIKLRLLQDVFVNGQRIPSGSFVFGNAAVDGERLKVVISSIQFQNHLYPVALTVFDLDGIEGINIPGSAGRDVIKQSADQGIQSVGGLSFDPSLKAQAAAAGVNAAKSLLSKKVKQERVTVKAGYKVLLRDENEDQINKGN